MGPCSKTADYQNGFESGVYWIENASFQKHPASRRAVMWTVENGDEKSVKYNCFHQRTCIRSFQCGWWAKTQQKCAFANESASVLTAGETKSETKVRGSAKNKEQREGLRRATDSFSPHPLPLLAHPLPTSPHFFAHPSRAPSLARFFTRLFDLRLEKEMKQLLHRLYYGWKTCEWNLCFLIPLV